MDTKTAGNLRFFDEKQIPDDVWRVLRTASILSIGEFRVFELAYKNWYGETATESAIEGFFIPYMFQDRVPPWVRHYCTRVINDDASGSLDPVSLGVSLREATQEDRWRGIEYLLWIASAMIVLFILADTAAKLIQTKCVLPPCY